MNKLTLTSLLAVALACNACTPDETAEGGPLDAGSPSDDAFKNIWAIAACPEGEQDIQGTVNIIIPNSIDGKAIGRNNRVNYRAEVLGPNSTVTGRQNNGQPASGWVANGPQDFRPFDVFMLDTVDTFGETGFVQVRVILRANSDWEFLSDEAGGFYGVGRNDWNDNTLCGALPVEDNVDAVGQQARYVASFYINLDNLYATAEGYEAPFTIALMAGNTPILIDPKVWNDGATTPPPPPPPPPSETPDPPAGPNRADD